MTDQSEPPRVHHTDIQLRFADTDALGHVNNGSYVVFAETGRLDFLKSLGGEVRSLILAHLSVDFRKQVLYGAAVSVDSWIEVIGRTSMAIHQNIRADGEIAAEVRSVVVSFDYTAQRSAPWSDATRALLTPWVAAD